MHHRRLSVISLNIHNFVTKVNGCVKQSEMGFGLSGRKMNSTDVEKLEASEQANNFCPKTWRI